MRQAEHNFRTGSGGAADRYPTPTGSHGSAAQPVCPTDGDSLPPCRKKGEKAANRDLDRKSVV